MAAAAHLAALCTLFLAVVIFAAGIHEDDCLECSEAKSRYLKLMEQVCIISFTQRSRVFKPKESPCFFLLEITLASRTGMGMLDIKRQKALQG